MKPALLGVDEATHAAFEEAIGDQGQNEVAEASFEAARAQEHGVRANRAVVAHLTDVLGDRFRARNRAVQRVEGRSFPVVSVERQRAVRITRAPDGGPDHAAR